MSGEIELAPQRALTHLIGHDAAGYFGRQSVNALRRLGDLYPANLADYPLRGGERYAIFATNCRINTQIASDGISEMCVTRHTAQADVTEVAVVLSNAYVDRNGTKFEFAGQSQVSVQVGIEYPIGSRVQTTFSGLRSGMINVGGFASTDFLPVSIPAGADFKVAVAYYGATGYLCKTMASNATWGEGSTASATRVNDRTYPGAGADPSARSVNTWPFAIISRTTHGAVLGHGDSIVEGTGDSYDAGADTAASSGFGLIGRAVSGARGYQNTGVAGDNLNNFIATGNLSHRFSAARFGYVKNIVCEGGVNSIASNTLAEMQEKLITVWNTARANLFDPSDRVFQTTITPSTTSTDSFATLANQTAATGFSTAGNGTREQLNDWLRDGAPIVDGAAVAIGTVGALRTGSDGHPLHAVFDVADVVESSRNSGKWKVDGTANKYTGDGLHPNRAGYLLVKTSGVIDLSMLA